MPSTRRTKREQRNDADTERRRSSCTTSSDDDSAVSNNVGTSNGGKSGAGTSKKKQRQKQKKSVGAGGADGRTTRSGTRYGRKESPEPQTQKKPAATAKKSPSRSTAAPAKKATSKSPSRSGAAKKVQPKKAEGADGSPPVVPADVERFLLGAELLAAKEEEEDKLMPLGGLKEFLEGAKKEKLDIGEEDEEDKEGGGLMSLAGAGAVLKDARQYELNIGKSRSTAPPAKATAEPMAEVEASSKKTAGSSSSAGSGGTRSVLRHGVPAVLWTQKKEEGTGTGTSSSSPRSPSPAEAVERRVQIDLEVMDAQEQRRARASTGGGRSSTGGIAAGSGIPTMEEPTRKTDAASCISSIGSDSPQSDLFKNLLRNCGIQTSKKVELDEKQPAAREQETAKQQQQQQQQQQRQKQKEPSSPKRTRFGATYAQKSPAKAADNAIGAATAGVGKTGTAKTKTDGGNIPSAAGNIPSAAGKTYQAAAGSNTKSARSKPAKKYSSSSSSSSSSSYDDDDDDSSPSMYRRMEKYSSSDSGGSPRSTSKSGAGGAGGAGAAGCKKMKKGAGGGGPGPKKSGGGAKKKGDGLIPVTKLARELNAPTDKTDLHPLDDIEKYVQQTDESNLAADSDVVAQEHGSSFGGDVAPPASSKSPGRPDGSESNKKPASSSLSPAELADQRLFEQQLMTDISMLLDRFRGSPRAKEERDAKKPAGILKQRVSYSSDEESGGSRPYPGDFVSMSATKNDATEEEVAAGTGKAQYFSGTKDATGGALLGGSSGNDGYASEDEESDDYPIIPKFVKGGQTDSERRKSRTESKVQGKTAAKSAGGGAAGYVTSTQVATGHLLVPSATGGVARVHFKKPPATHSAGTEGGGLRCSGQASAGDMPLMSRRGTDDINAPGSAIVPNGGNRTPVASIQFRQNHSSRRSSQGKTPFSFFSDDRTDLTRGEEVLLTAKRDRFNAEQRGTDNKIQLERERKEALMKRAMEQNADEQECHDEWRDRKLQTAEKTTRAVRAIQDGFMEDAMHHVDEGIKSAYRYEADIDDTFFAGAGDGRALSFDGAEEDDVRNDSI